MGRGGGFTILEVTIVAIIIAGAAALAVPRLALVIERSRAREGEQLLRILWGAQKRYEVEHGVFTDVLADLDVQPRPSAYFAAPAVSSADPIARVTRSGSYTLEISAAGQVTCDGGPPGLCSQLGY